MSSSAAGACPAPAASRVVQIQEMPRLQERFGGGTATQIATQVTDLLSDEPGPLVRVGLDRAGRLLVLMPETAPHVVRSQLGDLARRIAATRFALGNEDTVRVTPVTGWVSFSGAGSGEELLDRARTATRVAGHHLDLLPVEWTPALDAVPEESTEPRRRDRVVDRLRLPGQFLATLVLGIGLPFVLYVVLGSLGWDVSGVAYWVVMGALVVTAASIWIEGLYAFDPPQPPERAGCAVPLRLGRDRGVPAQRGGHHRGHRRGVPARASTPATCRSWSPTTPRRRCRSRTSCTRWPDATRGSCRSRSRTAPRRRRTSTPR